MSKKLVVIGMDGLDPVIARKMMDAGELPNFKKLAEAGSFYPLGTSNPPQSPVAWSNFISGHNPGHHDVFDFISRDPKTYLPEIGMTEVKKVEAKTFKDLFAGLSGPSVKTRRKGKAFWDYLSENNIPSTILRCPVTFPAEPLQGKLITGMGTPDIKGTQGVFSYFTTGFVDKKDIQGRVAQVSWEGDTIKTTLTGPKVRKDGKTVESEVPLIIKKIGDRKISIEIEGQKSEFEVGNWSDWFHVPFKVGFMKKVWGLCRFHLNELEPEFALYGSPVNIDPKEPAMPISYPKGYAKEIFEKVGPYYTQGMPYDTWALNEGRIDEETFLTMAYEIQRQNLENLRAELTQYDSGFLFCYFGITDLISHMFWRYIDPDHPNKGENTNPKVRNAISDVYKHVDGVLAEIVEKVGSDVPLMVMSDHGFGSFRRAFHVNSWLRDNGYLALQDGAVEGMELFSNVDWSQTKAYSVGFGGIYINQFGREKSGIVYKGAEAEDLKKELTDKLLKIKDGDKSVVKKIYPGEELYSGDHAERGPDLFIGFDKGFRASWQTALGAAPSSLIEDNMKKWGGDHLCDPDLVPGVLFSNKPLTVKTGHTLLDIAPTILAYFGIKPDQESEGRHLF